MRFVKALAASALIIVGAGSANAASQTSEQKLAKILEGRVAGKPVDCIYLPSVRDTRVINGTAIVYDAGSTIYVNWPDHGARSLSSGDILSTRRTGSQLCNVDIVNILDQSTQTWRGFISLGDFVPYTKVRTSAR